MGNIFKNESIFSEEERGYLITETGNIFSKHITFSIESMDFNKDSIELIGKTYTKDNYHNIDIPLNEIKERFGCDEVKIKRRDYSPRGIKSYKDFAASMDGMEIKIHKIKIIGIKKELLILNKDFDIFGE